VFGPVAVVAVRWVGGGEEGAVAAVFGFEEGDVGVGGDGGAGFGGEADEGVVAGVEQEGGDGDFVEDAGGGGFVVVVGRGAEARVEGGDAIVEVAERGDGGGALGIEGAGKENGFATEAAEEGAEEFALVEAVLPLVEGGGGGIEIGCGADADYAAELGWGIGAEVAGQLEDEVSAHGVADKRDGGEVLGLEEEAHDVIDVGGHAGVIERGGEAGHLVVLTAAVAHVHADDVAAGAPELVGVADDVLRVGGTFETVDDDDRGAIGALGQGLPVTLAEYLAGDLGAVRGRDFYELPRGWRKMAGAREEVAGDGLQVAVAEPGAWMECGVAGGKGCWGAGRH